MTISYGIVCVVDYKWSGCASTRYRIGARHARNGGFGKDPPDHQRNDAYTVDGPLRRLCLRVGTRGPPRGSARVRYRIVAEVPTPVGETHRRLSDRRTTPTARALFIAAPDRHGVRRPYENVVANLSDLDPVSVCCLPDGSVDDHYELGPDDDRVASREAFARAVADGRGSLPRRRVDREPGGQAVNAARQAAALGDDVTLLGHLDHEVFERLDPSVETVSFGAPSEVDVLRFEESDLMLVAESSELGSWSGATLREDRLLAAVCDADVVCVGNWASAPGLEAAFDALAEAVSETVVVVDPGAVRGLAAERVDGLLDALRSLSSTNEVVLSLSERELSALASRVGGDTADDAAERLAAVRDAASLRLAVLHEASRAVGVSVGDDADDVTVTTVPNVETDRVVTTTGAGDRFSAGLGRARAAGWATEEALALGNLCATYRVATGGTGTPTELRAFADATLG